MERVWKLEIVVNGIGEGGVVGVEVDKEMRGFWGDFMYDGFVEGDGVWGKYGW